MRMWMVDPKLLCRKHLLGEHVETHMFVGTIRKNVSITGYIENGLIETDSIVSRHEALSTEMTNRGMKHNSPIANEDVEHISEYLMQRNLVGYVDTKANLRDLATRCEECRKRIMEAGITW